MPPLFYKRGIKDKNITAVYIAGGMPPLFYKRGIKSKNPVLSLRGALANILSLRGALATKQSRFYKRGIKDKNPVLSLRGALANILSLRGASATKQSRFYKRGNKRQKLRPVIARSVSDEAISLSQKGELKTKTPSFNSRRNAAPFEKKRTDA